MHMTKLEADFRIVTPLFMSGADPQSAELRVLASREFCASGGEHWN